jgi:hypothetical protein
VATSTYGPCRGRSESWFRAAQQTGQGSIRAGGVQADVTFEQADEANHQAIDDTYRTKYAHHANTYVKPMVSPTATAATLRLTPR